MRRKLPGEELAKEQRRRVSVSALLFVALRFNLLDQDLPEFDPQHSFVLVLTRNNDSTCLSALQLL